MEPVTTENKNTAGELLKQGRLRQRLSIGECAKRTHIAPRYIEALEEEKWEHLPSESHRLGFLRLYSRFLGVPVDDVLALYRQKQKTPPPSEAPHLPERAKEPPKKAEKRRPIQTWSPTSIPQLIGFLILILLSAWLIYHAVSPNVADQNMMPWARRRTPHQARLVTTKPSISIHKIQLKASASTWLRVTSRNQLLFEGILPAGATKEWTGPGPFQLKMANIGALSLFWNDQPFDLSRGARGSTNDIRIPPQ